MNELCLDRYPEYLVGGVRAEASAVLALDELDWSFLWIKRKTSVEISWDSTERRIGNKFKSALGLKMTIIKGCEIHTFSICLFVNPMLIVVKYSRNGLNGVANKYLYTKDSWGGLHRKRTNRLYKEFLKNGESM